MNYVIQLNPDEPESLDSNCREYVIEEYVYTLDDMRLRQKSDVVCKEESTGRTPRHSISSQPSAERRDGS